MRINKKSVFYGALMLMSSSILLQVLGFLYRVLLSRLAGAEGMGIYQLVMSAYAVVSALTLSGFTMAVSRLTAQRRALGDTGGVRFVLRKAMTLFALFFLLVGLVVLFQIDFVSGGILGDTRTRQALLLMLPCLFLTGFENIYKSLFYGIQKFVPPMVSEVTEQVVRILFVVGFLLHFKPDSPAEAAALILAGMIVSEVVSFVCLSVFYKIFLPKKRAGKPMIGTRDTLRCIFEIALPVAGAGLINNLLGSANAILIPQKLVESGMLRTEATEALGILFGMTMPLILLPSALIFPLTSVLVPKISEEMALHRIGSVRRKAAKAIHVTSLIAMPAAAMTIPLGPMIAQFIYRQPAAGGYMAPLAVAALFSFYQIITGSLLNGMGYPKKAAASIIIVGVIQLLFTYFTVSIPGVGLTGFVAGDVVSSVVGALLNLTWIVRHTGLCVQWENWFVTPLLSAALAGCVTRFFFLFALGNGMPDLPALLQAGIFGAISYGVSLRILGISLVRYLERISIKALFF